METLEGVGVATQRTNIARTPPRLTDRFWVKMRKRESTYKHGLFLNGEGVVEFSDID